MAHRRKGLSRMGLALALVAAIAATGVLAGSTSAKTTASKGTLTIGVITSVGGQIIDYPFTVSAVTAGVRAINKAGGVNGYKLGLFYCNTQGNPNQEVACARQAVDKNVIATVGGFVFTNPQGYYQTLKDANIADVGQLRGSVQSFTFSNSFPLVSVPADGEVLHRRRVRCVPDPAGAQGGRLQHVGHCRGGHAGDDPDHQPDQAGRGDEQTARPEDHPRPRVGLRPGSVRAAGGRHRRCRRSVPGRGDGGVPERRALGRCEVLLLSATCSSASITARR